MVTYHGRYEEMFMVRNLMSYIFKDNLIIESQIALMFMKSLTNQVIMIGSQQ
jgi:hypothetical protein